MDYLKEIAVYNFQVNATPFRPYREYDRDYSWNRRRIYDDLLLYDLLKDRNYYREKYYDKLYDVNDCNPYYNNLWCKKY